MSLILSTTDNDDQFTIGTTKLHGFKITSANTTLLNDVTINVIQFQAVEGQSGSRTFNLYLNDQVSPIATTNLTLFSISAQITFSSLNYVPQADDILYLTVNTNTTVRSDNEDDGTFYTTGFDKPEASSTLLRAEIVYSDNESGDPCFTKTCEILTPEGYKNVTELKKGDLVYTSDKRIVKIINLYQGKSKNLPFLIPKDKYGENLPNKDTHISKDHGYFNGNKWTYPYLEGLNKEWKEEQLIYYNFGLPNHFKDNLIVNGLEMESWDGEKI